MIVEQQGDRRTLLGWIERRLELIEEASEVTLRGTIFNRYSQIKMNRCLAQIHDMRGDTALANVHLQKISELQTEYNNLVQGIY